MSPPIYTPDGSEVSEIVLPDGSTASEVIGPDGNVVFEAGPDIPDSGISRWTFDDEDTDSGTALDVWGNNDGIINGATTGATGANQTYTTGESYSFDGSDDHIQCSTSVLDSTQPFSIALWVNFDTVQGRLMNTNDNDNGMRLWMTDGGVRFDIEDSTTKGVAQGTNPGTGNWVHYIGTYDGSSEMTLYENGSSVATTTGVTSGGDPENLRIGGRSEFVDGQIDDARIYDKELNATEASNLYNTGSI